MNCTTNNSSHILERIFRLMEKSEKQHEPMNLVNNRHVHRIQPPKNKPHLKAQTVTNQDDSNTSPKPTKLPSLNTICSRQINKINNRNNSHLNQHGEDKTNIL